MSMPSMRACDVIILTQVGAYANRDSLFTSVQMNGAGYKVLTIQFKHFFLEKPNGQHLAMHFKQFAVLNHELTYLCKQSA